MDQDEQPDIVIVYRPEEPGSLGQNAEAGDVFLKFLDLLASTLASSPTPVDQDDRQDIENRLEEPGSLG